MCERSKQNSFRWLIAVGAAFFFLMTSSATMAQSGSTEPEISEEVVAPAVIVEPVQAALQATEAGGEAVKLRWRLSGVLGFFASWFVPSSGDALLTFVPRADDQVEIGFLVTAPKREGEYFLYGSRVDESTGSPVAVWSGKDFSGKKKSWHASIEDPATIDYASAIYRLRWYAPEKTTPMTIWNRGKAYAAIVKPLGIKNRRIGGTRMKVRGYAIKGAPDTAGRTFDDRIYVYFALDEQSTPVEIVGKNGMVRARITLVETTGIAHMPAAQPSESVEP